MNGSRGQQPAEQSGGFVAYWDLVIRHQGETTKAQYPVSIIGDTYNPAVHSPGQPVLSDSPGNIRGT